MATSEIRGAAVELDAESVSTIVAALRLFQRTYQDCDDEVLSQDFPEIFTAQHLRFGVVVEPAPLRTDDIDDLCERLNGLDAVELRVSG